MRCGLSSVRYLLCHCLFWSLVAAACGSPPTHDSHRIPGTSTWYLYQPVPGTHKQDRRMIFGHNYWYTLIELFWIVGESWYFPTASQPGSVGQIRHDRTWNECSARHRASCYPTQLKPGVIRVVKIDDENDDEIDDSVLSLPPASSDSDNSNLPAEQPA
jgi:hypothetical protein